MTKLLYKPTEAAEVLGMSRSVDQTMAAGALRIGTHNRSAQHRGPNGVTVQAVDLRCVLLAWRTAIPPQFSRTHFRTHHSEKNAWERLVSAL